MHERKYRRSSPRRTRKLVRRRIRELAVVANSPQQSNNSAV